MKLLKEAQKKLQISSYQLLKERIEHLKKEGKQVKEFSKAKGLLPYIKLLTEKIDTHKEKFLQEIMGKVIQENEDYYASTLKSPYKNNEDFLAKPLALTILGKKKSEEAVKMLCEEKKKFEEVDKKELKKHFKSLVEYSKKRLNIGGDIYSSLAKKKQEQFFKEMPQRVALAIAFMDSNDLANTLMVELLRLQTLDNADVENTSNTRQSFGAELGEKLHERVAWSFLDRLQQEESTKELFNLYFSESFEKIEMLSCPLWHKWIELEVGQKMLDLALETEMIGEYTKPHDEGNFNYLKLSKEFLESIKSEDKSIAYSASMTYKPMVIEPIDWTEMYKGGFLQDDDDFEDSRFNLSLIKASSSKDRKALVNKPLPKEVLNAVNHLQKSAFKIHQPMLDVLMDYHSDINYLAKKNRVDFAYYRILKEILSMKLEKLSKKELYDYFKKSKFIKLKNKELSRTDKKRIDTAHKSIAKEENIEHFALVSNIYYEIAKYKQGFDTIVEIAKEMRTFEPFYFVWRMDFRGRLYPQQTLLNPQAGDLAKSLLLFSKEKALTKEGLKWFCIHGANCYGEVDKQPFPQRVKWVEVHRDKIVASANDYRKEDFWKKAGDPFKFLAWAFEYARYVKNPQIFTTGMPVAIDGSNNGFQHITALLRDVEGAKMVNVLPQYENGEMVVADFYATVATKLKMLMQQEVEKFEANKEAFIAKSGLYFKEKEEEVFVPEYAFKEVAEILETIEVSTLSHSQFFTTLIVEQNPKFEILEEALKKVEREIRKEVGEQDLEEVHASMIDELERIYKQIKRQIKKGNINIKKDKAYKKKFIKKLEPSSFYTKLIAKNIIKRKFVKGPVMTESYGSSTAGKAKALLETLEGIDLLKELDADKKYLLAQSITRLLEKALDSVSKSPKKYKNWMKKYAKEIAKKGAIKWKTPLGLEVEQVEYKCQTIKVAIGDYRKVNFNLYTDEIDPREHTKGLSPNFIHSLDATHLMMSINALEKKGVHDIITVHDSFATHANEVTLMSNTLRESFIALHEKPILETFTTDVQEVFEIDKKKIPYVKKEAFNLDDIKKSDYFFS